jgi:hypothetical protein
MYNQLLSPQAKPLQHGFDLSLLPHRLEGLTETFPYTVSIPDSVLVFEFGVSVLRPGICRQHSHYFNSYVVFDQTNSCGIREWSEKWHCEIPIFVPCVTDSRTIISSNL